MQRKREVALRILRGEPLRAISRELGVPLARLERWRDGALAGTDAGLRANTVKRRTQSLFRQGSYGYRCLRTTRDDWFDRLMAALGLVLEEHQELAELPGKI